jgi:Ca-activated chloride channel homolog
MTVIVACSSLQPAQPPQSETISKIAYKDTKKGSLLVGVAGALSAGYSKSVLSSASYPQFNTEEYDKIDEIGFREASHDPLSTFSIDVDTASYANVRRFLNDNRLPPKDAVRIEEMINYFSYNYREPKGNAPFSIITEMSDCPWLKTHKLLHIGIKAKDIQFEKIPPSNLVFLLDVSGSMSIWNKLPLLKKGIKLLVDKLRGKDRIAIVVYAGAAGLILDSTPANEKATILKSIDNLEAGGSTAGGEGIKLAYEVAQKNFIKDGNNRVILATDGDFNVGVSSDGDLVRMIEEKRNSGIFLTVLGFGVGNIKDSKMEKLADKGNGNYAYIDSLLEAKKVLVKEMGATLFTIAKDIKIQIEFNPVKVKAYRLIGYENRILSKEDFKDDRKDAGELGAGHTVTALYEIIPAGSTDQISDVDNLKYQTTTIKDTAKNSEEMCTIKLRFKAPEANESSLKVQPVKEAFVPAATASDDFKFSAAVAAFGMLLRNSEFKGTATYKNVITLARKSKGKDEEGYRAEFIRLVEQAEMLDEKKGD